MATLTAWPFWRSYMGEIVSMVYVVLFCCVFMFGFWAGYRWCMDEEAELRRRRDEDTDFDTHE